MSKKDLLPYYRLLSKERRLTVQEEEAIIDKIVGSKIHSKTDVRQRWLPGLSRGVLVGGLLLVAVPLAILLSWDGDEEFVERGEEEAPVFVVQCVGESEAELCRIGETLAFRVNTFSDRPYFAAFAIHDSSGKVYWYYPTDEESTSVSVNRNSRRGVLMDAIRIGEEHKKGSYSVYGIFSKDALTRTDIRDAFEDERPWSTDTITVIETTVEIK